MILDFYQQADLFAIANCARKAKLRRWLEDNHIPYGHDSNNEVIAHKAALARAFGVEENEKREDTVELCFE